MSNVAHHYSRVDFYLSVEVNLSLYYGGVVQNYGFRKEMVSWSNLEKLCSCSRTWMVSALACGNKWIQVGTYKVYIEFCQSLFSVSERLTYRYDT